MFSQVISSLQPSVERLPALGADPAFSPFELPAGSPEIAAAFWSDSFGRDTLFDELLIERAASDRQRRFGGEVFSVVPMYVSSVCRERCLYCNYRAANTGLKIDRVRLTDDEIAREASYLMTSKGYRVIELVYASDPKMTPEVIARHVRLVKRLLDETGGGVVGLNAEPLETDDYRMLREAGVEFSIVWQETYDRRTYGQMHPGTTKKTDYDYRLDCYERALDGGIPFVGMGVLSGLAAWRADWAMLMQHEAWLRDKYPAAGRILGLPRLKPAAGAEIGTSFHLPTDSEFRSAVALHKIFAPDTVPFVSTRERWDMCTRLAAGGGCLFTFDCSTIPGGYSLGRSGSQFQTGSYDPAIFREPLAEAGLHARFDWDFCLTPPTPVRDTLAAAG